MIGYLHGRVTHLLPEYCLLDVHGVGYKVFTMPRVLESTRAGEELSLHVHLVVREDAMELFGFPLYEELELFQMLIGVSGIGPRSALGILGLETADKLVSAIAHGDVGYLTKVSGVGKKSAEKIVLELREKVSMLDIKDLGGSRRGEEDALEALRALGYRADEAREALRLVPEEAIEPSARIREALRILARQ